MIISLFVLVVGGLMLLGCLYWFMQSAYNSKASQACIAILSIIVLTFGVPMLAVHVYYM